MRSLKDVDRNEVYRYMGFKDEKPDENICRITETIISELAQNASPMHCIRETEIRIRNSKTVLDFCETDSILLSNHLKGSDSGYVLAATIGAEADRIISKYSLLSPVKAVAAQAAATAMIEQYADDICENIKNECGSNLKPRFSPGYGDFPLSFQKSVLDFLDAYKRAGICLTDGGIMTPVKSITAILGKTTDEHCNADKCRKCPNVNCDFRKL